MEQAYQRITEILEAWQSSHGGDEALKATIADARALTDECHRLDGRLAKQRARMTGLFGAPSPGAVREFQNQPGIKARLDDIERRRGFGKDWQGADALLDAAKERGVELDAGLLGLIKFTDRVIRSEDQTVEKALAELEGTVTESCQRIARLDAIDFGVVGLFVAVSAYLSSVLAFRIFEDRDEAFHDALKDQGIDDASRLVFGAALAGLPFAGVTYDSVSQMAESGGTGPGPEADAAAARAFLDTFAARLGRWELGAHQHATIAEALIAKKA